MSQPLRKLRLLFEDSKGADQPSHLDSCNTIWYAFTVIILVSFKIFQVEFGSVLAEQTGLCFIR